MYLIQLLFSNVLSASSLIISLFLFIVASIVFVILDIALSETKLFKKLHLLFSIITYYLIVSLVGARLEIYLATTIVILIYLYVLYSINKTNNQFDNNKRIYKDNMFWYCIIMIVLLIVMMESEKIWLHLPSIFLNIQFPWRLWALVQIFASILVGLIAYYFDYKKSVTITMIILVAVTMAANQPLFEKRLQHTYNFDAKWETELTDECLNERYTLGFCREYVPQVFLDSTYKSEYNNSLYSKIRSKILYGFNKESYYYKPVILLGEGEVIINDAFSPNYNMDINIDEDSLIQLPLIYYPGYEISVTDLTNNQTYIVESINVDGLVAFELQEGNYSVSTDYVGTPIRQVSVVYFYVSISLTCLALLYALFIENEKYKRLITILKKDKNIANK